MNTIDINCDMGESFGNYRIGNDLEIFPYITSSNIACGFHGGDPVVMENTIRTAVEYGVKIGAHPGYPDLAGFGRRKMDLPTSELKAAIKYQLAAIMGMAESLDASVGYVKPHGALYNTTADDEETGLTLVGAIREIDGNLMIMGLAGSLFQQICETLGMQFVAEAFADRMYEPTGRLRSRSLDGAVIEDPAAAASQVLDIVQNQQVTAYDGSVVGLKAQSICIHGDNPGAVEILKAIDESMRQQGIQKKSFL